MTGIASRVLLSALVLIAGAAGADSRSTFTLDEMSFVAFGSEDIVFLPAGSTLVFDFSAPNADGSVAFTISPEDVSIPPIDLGGGRSLSYSMVAPASGSMRDTSEGRQLSFSTTIRADLDAGAENEGGAFDYALTFTTEEVIAVNVAGTERMTRTGLRLIDGVWYGQIVAATTNREYAYPAPGSAVNTVLSGSFDQVP